MTSRLEVEEYECMNCGAKAVGGLLMGRDSALYEIFPNGWAVHIEDNEDYLLMCDGCVARVAGKETA